MACAIRSRRLAADPELRDQHVESCLRCQAEAVRYRTMLRELGMMRANLIPAPAGLPASVTGSEAPDRRRRASGREAVVATAGLAAVAGAIAIWRRAASA